MDKFIVIWNILNGKKVTIGALLMLAAQALRLTGKGEWADIITQLSDILFGAGAGIASIGSAHKLVKKEW